MANSSSTLDVAFLGNFARYQSPSLYLPKNHPRVLFLLDANYLFVIDVNGFVWRFSKRNNYVSFKDKPTKVPGLTNIVFINGYDGTYAAIDNSGKVFVWGDLSSISELYEDSDEPRCIEALTNMEGIAVGNDLLFA
ncbi:hypothetical protein P9112_010067 [Eukaryota sp. TZLM1-RC]